MDYDCLIIDDEDALAENTAEYFNMFNVRTAYVTSAKACHTFFEANKADLILLDINLGDASGFTLCKQLREMTTVPIIFISARQGDDDQIIALNIGGDDYIQKPYSLGVILAKVKAVLKRHQKKEDAIYVCRKLRVDFILQRVFVANQEIILKGMEYKLLSYLIKHRNHILDKDELFRAVWEDTITSDNTLNVHIHHLREKIEENPEQPEFIKTVWGRGYMFEGSDL